MRCQAIIWTNSGLISIWPFGNEYKWNLNHNTRILIHENVFENVFKQAVILQWASMCIEYRKTSNIRRTLGGNEIVDHSDVVGASPVGAAEALLQLHLHSRLNIGFHGFGKNSRQTVRESFKCWDLVRLILQTLRYIFFTCKGMIGFGFPVYSH